MTAFLFVAVQKQKINSEQMFDNTKRTCYIVYITCEINNTGSKDGKGRYRYKRVSESF